MAYGDPRTDESVPAAAAVDDDGVVEAAAVVVAKAAEEKLSPTGLGRMLVAAGRTIGDEDDLLTLLQRVTEIAHEVIEGADSAGVTIDFSGRTYTAVHTDHRTLRVDSEQYDAGDGPCLHAARTGTVVLVDATDATQRWPRFAAAAAAEGIYSFLAAPLHAEGQSLGSFNLYGRTRAVFDTLDAEIIDLLTATVSRTIADFARFNSARDVAESIQRALATRGPIEQAKGMLMAIHGLTADEAFGRLRTQSQNTNTPLRDVATTLITQIGAIPPAVTITLRGVESQATE